MSEEHVKFEGRLRLNEQKQGEARIRLQGLVRSLRDLLDPTKKVEHLDGDLISAQALDFASLQIDYQELLAEADRIRDLLGR